MENKELKESLDRIEHILKVILCCSLLPKNKENERYFSCLTEEAEKMIIAQRDTNESDLLTMVADILADKRAERQRPKIAPPMPPPLITDMSGYAPDSFFCEPVNCIRSWFNKLRNKGCPDIPDCPPPPPEK